MLELYGGNARKATILCQPINGWLLLPQRSHAKNGRLIFRTRPNFNQIELYSSVEMLQLLYKSDPTHHVFKEGFQLCHILDFFLFLWKLDMNQSYFYNMKYKAPHDPEQE